MFAILQILNILRSSFTLHETEKRCAHSLPNEKKKKGTTHLKLGQCLLLFLEKDAITTDRKRSHERKARNSPACLASLWKLGRGITRALHKTDTALHGLVSRVWTGFMLPLVSSGMRITGSNSTNDRSSELPGHPFQDWAGWKGGGARAYFGPRVKIPKFKSWPCYYLVR